MRFRDNNQVHMFYSVGILIAQEFENFLHQSLKDKVYEKESGRYNETGDIVKIRWFFWTK